MKGKLVLENGNIFEGAGFGFPKTIIAEIVFNTGMTGYQETLTDPSYKGQIVLFTYPHIGNTGINDEDVESAKPGVEGIIVRKLSRSPSNFRSKQDVSSYLYSNSITGIENIDTRMLTRIIRDRGTMTGILSTDGKSNKELFELLKNAPVNSTKNLVRSVTCSDTSKWDINLPARWYLNKTEGNSEGQPKITLIDFGAKRNILKFLKSSGFRVTYIPAESSIEDILHTSPDGVVLSNGPGNPEELDYAIDTIKVLIDKKIPLFGICLGHQLIALAMGAETFKLPFGHHGINHPVKNLLNGNIIITSQNHNYAVNRNSMQHTGLVETFRSLNDKTVEGMHHRTLPIFSVQFHPEASPGPHDASGWNLQALLQIRET